MSELKPVTVIVKRVLTGDEQEFCVRYAIINGWRRTDPKRRWATKERKEACRWALEHMLTMQVLPKT